MDWHLSKHPESSVQRIFVALELPRLLRDELVALQSRFVACGSAVKWVPPDSLHLTMRFLGEIESSRLGAINRAVVQSAETTGIFPVHISSLGAFPNCRTPRILWVGFHCGHGYANLTGLFHALDTALTHAGIPGDARTFLPHITFARVRRGVSREDQRCVALALNQASDVKVIHDSFWVDSLTVMRSDLTESGPVYSSILRASLTRA